MKDASKIIDARDKTPEIYRCYHCGESFSLDAGGKVEDEDVEWGEPSILAWCARCDERSKVLSKLNREWRDTWVLWPKGYHYKVQG